ncbi:hypothetical protein, partial [Bacteroides sp.]|uniref:hypothetical protein n=1 Tax=Bacteroides sp. TaxID=29523 RepID=UPI0025C3F54E
IKWTIAEYHFAVLIIWRSLVQAQAGPQSKRLIPKEIQFFLFTDPPDMNLLLLVDLVPIYSCCFTD